MSQLRLMLAKNSLAVLKRGIDDELFSGAAYALISKRQSGGVGTLGRVAFDRETDRVNRDTLFDVASLTKPLVTAMAALQLVAAGKATLEDEAARLLGETDNRLLPGVTLRHLLTHTSGLPALPATTTETEDIVVAAINTPPVTSAGQRYLYSDAGYLILGELVRRLSGRSLSDWYEDTLKPALHLESSGFQPALTLPIAATAEDEALDGLPHDSLARRAGGVTGHAGLFASIADLAAYARALLGTGRALLPLELFSRLFVNEIGSLGGQSLAFFTQGNDYLPPAPGFHAAFVGHSGFTGCFLLIDRDNEAAAALLTNAVLNSEEEAKSKYLELRRDWLAAAAADLRLTAD